MGDACDHGDGPLDPVEVLDRIVYLLDRRLEESRRVRAYANARDLVAELDADELLARHRDRTLTELPGIGPATSAVIAEALDGKVPKKLTELEATNPVDVGEGAELRAALRGDCHLHSEWSDGGATIEAMAEAARALGHEYVVLTDHSPRLTIAHGLDPERLRRQLDVIDDINAAYRRDGVGFRILTGIEVDILDDGSLDQEEELLDRLDVVVASVHSKLGMDPKDMTRRMAVAVANPHVDILGHCTGQKLPGRMRPIGKSDFAGRVGSSFDADVVFAACARFDTAVEINCRPERMDPPDQLLELALEWGCKLAIDTDAHAPGQLEWQPFGCDRAARHGVTPEQVVNTWRAEELVEWAASHPTS
ncbi:MAG: PHP domain-containing protein [Acidimicrobiia bacterium]